MASGAPGDVTSLLIAWRAGERSALDRLTPIVYAELHRLAAAYMRRERADHTLEATALIHEAYLRLVDQSLPRFAGRAHFFGVAAQIMRQILVDFARAHRSAKRGSGEEKMPLDQAMELTSAPAADILDLHLALERLAVFDARKARVLELRYFGGLSREEVGEALGVTLATVKRDLALGEAWLRRELA